MEKTYKFKNFEEKIHALWDNAQVFRFEYYEKSIVSSSKKQEHPFVVVMPPPNVTGVLHMGHALNNSIQDILVRYYRMQRHPVLWVPGSDHAGIATQQVVERQLAKEGKHRQDIGREAFIERTWKVAHTNKQSIMQQLRRLGISCDWNRECFTLDESLSKAVREVFVQLYEKGLIYRSSYLINWSVGAGTALSDDEVEYKELHGKIYWITYPYVEGKGGITVATTRPETMFGDTAIAVNPSDERYISMVGKHVYLPLTDKKIPIIADEHVDIAFGTGALKVTPGHSFDDYEISKRHDIECINILNLDGSLNEEVPKKYQGILVQDARKIVAEDLSKQGFLEKTQEHVHQVGHCYRTGVPIEPLLSTQWFVRMEKLAKKALEVLHNGNIQFHPKHWENTYIHWMKNIRDWCISRQLWWGHRIPVWYDDDTGEMIVSREDPTILPENKGRNLRQDEDVLDTWFSSWLWPFTVFGWPQKTDDMARFYPTTTLVTAYDIIFFWVARMVMAGLEFTHEVPFKHIFIHGLVRDDKGRKMSKSLGNGIDPLEIINEFGVDSLRFTLAFLCKLGRDIPINKDNFQLGSHFANKLWNASRYLLMNIQECTLYDIKHISLCSAEQWIVYKLKKAQNNIQKAMQQYRIDDAAHIVYEYFWWDFCDWYIEISKIGLQQKQNTTVHNQDISSSQNKDTNKNTIVEKDRIASFLIWILEENLALLHPFMPFITEEIYQQLQNVYKTQYSLLSGKKVTCSLFDNLSEKQCNIQTSLDNVQNSKQQALEINAQNFSLLQDLVREVRTLRSEFNLSPKLKINFHVWVENTKLLQYLQEQQHIIQYLCGAEAINIEQKNTTKKGIVITGRGFVCNVFVEEHINIQEELLNVERKRKKLQNALAPKKKMLESDQFRAKAKQEYIETITKEVQEFEKQLHSIDTIEKELRGMEKQ